jgi:CrcB protein
MLIFGIALAGAVGAPTRYLVDGFVRGRSDDRWPVGTFVVNVTGSFALGLLTGFALYHAFPATPKTILGTGFCGAYTTFSTFSYEVVKLAEAGAPRAAARTLVASLVVPALAAALGLARASREHAVAFRNTARARRRGTRRRRA